MLVASRLINARRKSPMSTRLVNTNDFVAEQLEKLADGLPPSQAEQSATWRKCAAEIRALPHNRIMVQVTEEATFQTHVRSDLPKR
jgi:hypothetical protein